MARSLRSPVRHLVVILGDQLDPKSAALDGLRHRGMSLHHVVLGFPRQAPQPSGQETSE